MGEADKNEIFMSPAPHVATPVTTKILMSRVIFALLPLAAYGIYLFSFHALIRIIVSVVFCAGFEAAFRSICNLPIRLKDGSAVLTGLLLALIVPPNLPIWQLILGCFFAVVVGKEFFGGLGANVFNPALIGRAFLFVSFSKPMTSWVRSAAGSLDGLSSASKHAETASDVISSATPLSFINPRDGIISSVSELAEKMGADSVSELYTQLFLGNHAGCIGETSVLLISLGFIFLLWKKVIDWRITTAMLISAVGITWLAGINPILTVTSGGLMFGAVFMATDYVTSPVTPKGRLIFGAGCGIITALVRLYSGMPEGVMFSILIMNSTVPFLNKLIDRKYGYVKPVKAKKEAVK